MDGSNFYLHIATKPLHPPCQCNLQSDNRILLLWGRRESARQKCLRDEVILISNQKNLNSPDLSTEPAGEFDAIYEEH